MFCTCRALVPLFAMIARTGDTMRASVIALAVSIATLAPVAPSLSAQASLSPGHRVRVTPVEGNRFKGVLRSLSRDSLVVLVDGSENESRLARADLGSVEVYGGRGTFARLGVTIDL